MHATSAPLLRYTLAQAMDLKNIATIIANNVNTNYFVQAYSTYSHLHG